MNLHANEINRRGKIDDKFEKKPKSFTRDFIFRESYFLPISGII